MKLLLWNRISFSAHSVLFWCWSWDWCLSRLLLCSVALVDIKCSINDQIEVICVTVWQQRMHPLCVFRWVGCEREDEERGRGDTIWGFPRQLLMCSCLRLDHPSSLPLWGDRLAGEESKRKTNEWRPNGDEGVRDWHRKYTFLPSLVSAIV